MNRVSSRLKSSIISLNSLIVILSVAVAVLMVHRIYDFSRFNQFEASLLKKGTYYHALNEINLSKNRLTILLAIDIDCSYTKLSMPFYTRLLEKSRSGVDVRLIVVTEKEKEHVEAFLQQYGFSAEVISKPELAAQRFEITPTLVLINSERFILASYEGFLNSEGEADLLAYLD